MNDVFLDIDKQPEDSISIISERLEERSQTGQFASFRNEYFSLMNLNNNASILELGGGTGVIGRAYIKETNFNGKYVVSDLSEQLLKFGKDLAIKDKMDHLLDFKMIDAMSSKTNNELFYDAVIMHTLVSHVPEPKIVLNNAKEYLKTTPTAEALPKIINIWYLTIYKCLNLLKHPSTAETLPKL